MFHLAKAKDPSWETTEEEFNHLNIGPSLDEEEKQQLGDLLWNYCEVFAFTLGE